MVPSSSLVPILRPTVWLIITVCANQLVRSSGPSTVRTKSFWALIWSSQLIGGMSSEAPIAAFLNISLQSGFGCKPAREAMLPSLNSNQRPVSSSRAMIWATKLRSFRRARKRGWRNALNLRSCPKPNRMSESLTVEKVITPSNLLGAHLGALDRRNPRLLGPAHALAGDLNVDEIGLAFDRVLAGAGERLAQLGGVVNHLAVDAEAFGDRGHVHVRVAQVVVHELLGLHHAAAGDVVDDAAVRAAIGVFVVDHGDDRQLQPRHVPQRGRSEGEGAVAHEADHLLVRPRELDACRGSDARAEMGAIVEEQLAPADRVEVEAVQGDRARLVHDDGVRVGEPRHFPGQPVGDHRRAVPVRAVGDLRAQRLGLRAELLDLLRPLGGLLLERGSLQLLDR